MKIFVTGNLGYFGTPLTKILKEKHEVIGYDIKEKKDVLNYTQLQKSMLNSDIVVHTAAIPKPNESKIFDDYFQLNCIGTMNVIKAAIENKVKKFIFISSTGYYGVERGIPVKFPLIENQQTIPMYLTANDLTCRPCDLMYSQSKVIGENIIAFYGLTKQIQVISLRFPRIGDKEGPYGTKVTIENAINATIKAIESEKEMWFEAFNISDKLDTINISKSKEILNYSPIP
jgi:nucleoside-diphosphate-sugar epimerase